MFTNEAVSRALLGLGAALLLATSGGACGQAKFPDRPVKIVLDPGQDPDHLLRPGMSVTPTVYLK